MSIDCDTNGVRQMAEMKRVDRKKMEHLRELCIEKCPMERFVKSRMK